MPKIHVGTPSHPGNAQVPSSFPSQTAGAMLVCRRLLLSSKPKYRLKAFQLALPLVLHFNLLDRDFTAATHVATHGFPPASLICLCLALACPARSTGLPSCPLTRMFGNGYELTCVLPTPDVSPRVVHRAFTALRVFGLSHTCSQPHKGPPIYAGFDVKLCPPLRHTPFFKTHAKYL